jgi:glycosyltransferase involved in cell wall biosynthesis
MIGYWHLRTRILCAVKGFRARASTRRAKPNQDVRQLLVDVSVIYRHDARTGIQRVVRALLLHLLSLDIPGVIVAPVFATRKKPYCYASRDFLSAPHNKILDTAAVKVNPGDIFLGLDLAANILPKHEKQIREWKHMGAIINVVVYDLLPILNKGWFQRKTQRNFTNWLDFIALYSDSAICISEDVRSNMKRVIAQRYPNLKRHIALHRISLSGDFDASAPSVGMPTDAKALLDRLKNDVVTLMVGTIEPRKGYDKALAAFDLLWRTHPKEPIILVIAGKPGWKTAALQRTITRHPEINKRLFWLEDASDEFIKHLYRICAGVLVTSHAEGYGLPVIEACMQGKWVLARDIAVFHEFAHPNIKFFDDDSPEALAQAILIWLEHATTRDVKMDLEPVHSWSRSGYELLSSLDLPAPSAPPAPVAMPAAIASRSPAYKF